jgi:hypothetical protein
VAVVAIIAVEVAVVAVIAVEVEAVAAIAAAAVAAADGTRTRIHAVQMPSRL